MDCLELAVLEFRFLGFECIDSGFGASTLALVCLHRLLKALKLQSNGLLV